MTPPQADASGGESNTSLLSPDIRTYSTEKPAKIAATSRFSAHQSKSNYTKKRGKAQVTFLTFIKNS
jgi:hypothetical protein